MIFTFSQCNTAAVSLYYISQAKNLKG